MHTHPQWSTFLTMVGEKYKAVYAQGVLLGDIPLLDSPLSVNTKPMGEKLVAALGPGPAVLPRHMVLSLSARRSLNVSRSPRMSRTPIGSMAMQIGDPQRSARQSNRRVAETLDAEP
jgi:hypothetical protein